MFSRYVGEVDTFNRAAQASDDYVVISSVEEDTSDAKMDKNKVSTILVIRMQLAPVSRTCFATTVSGVKSALR